MGGWQGNQVRGAVRIRRKHRIGLCHPRCIPGRWGQEHRMGHDPGLCDFLLHCRSAGYPHECERQGRIYEDSVEQDARGVLQHEPHSYDVSLWRKLWRCRSDSYSDHHLDDRHIRYAQPYERGLHASGCRKQGLYRIQRKRQHREAVRCAHQFRHGVRRVRD